jgi:hypothetical protein
MTNRTGGGANSRVVGNYKDRKTEPVAHGVSVGSVSRLGGMVSVDTPYKALCNKQATRRRSGRRATSKILGPEVAGGW